MNNLLPTLITWLQLYGYPALWICICIAAVGAPLPVSLLLLAMGAFAALGDFALIPLVLTATSAAVCGDSIGYWIGYRLGPPLIAWLTNHTKLPFISPQTIKRAEKYFQERAGIAVFTSRCLVPSLGGVINILAGAERYPYRKFLVLDASGEAIGAIVPLVLGYLFGASWEAIGSLLTQISMLIVILFIAIYLSVLLIRMLRKMSANGALRENITMEVAKNTQEEALIPHESHHHQKKRLKQNSKKFTFPATLRRLQTYKSTDGLHTGYGFPTKTTSNPGHKD